MHRIEVTQSKRLDRVTMYRGLEDLSITQLLALGDPAKHHASSRRQRALDRASKSPYSMLVAEDRMKLSSHATQQLDRCLAEA